MKFFGRHNMKQRITIFLLTALMLILAGCGSKVETVTAATDAEQTQQTREIQNTQADTQAADPSSEPEYTGIYWRTWSEEIAGAVVEMNSYIVLEADSTGYWIAQDVGTLTWDESQLQLAVGAAYEITLIRENNTVNLLVYEFQDENGEWNPTVFEKINKLPEKIEKMLDKS